MKYENLIICGIPKAFDISSAVDLVQPLCDGMHGDDIQYDAYPAECDEDKGEDAIVMFKYDESSTGIYLIHNSIQQTLSLWLSPWAVEADVLIYAAFINAVLTKHKRARLFDKYAPLKGLTEDDVLYMIEERKKYLKRLLTTKDGFTMEGLNTCYTLKVEHLKPAASVDTQILELQNVFVKMQWEMED